MNIDPAIAVRHWEQAAIEQLAAQLQEQGYSIEREALLGNQRADLVGRATDGSLLVVEVKVPGRSGAGWADKIGALRDYARAHGGRFRLVLVRPPRNTSVSVDGLDQALKEYLESNVPAELVALAPAVLVQNVVDTEINAIAVHDDDVEVAGDASLTVEFRDGKGEPIAVETMPFGFRARLDRSNHIRDMADLRLDASSLSGIEGEVKR